MSTKSQIIGLVLYNSVFSSAYLLVTLHSVKQRVTPRKTSLYEEQLDITEIVFTLYKNSFYDARKYFL